jgi:hypothetical protein
MAAAPKLPVRLYEKLGEEWTFVFWLGTVGIVVMLIRFLTA